MVFGRNKVLPMPEYVCGDGWRDGCWVGVCSVQCVHGLWSIVATLLEPGVLRQMARLQTLRTV